jgi:hypothetical protein
MDLKIFYGGHSISDKGVLKLKLKTDFTQQEEAGALYATLAACKHKLLIGGNLYGLFLVDSLRIDNKFDTIITLKGMYDNKLFATLYDELKNTTEDEMCIVTIERSVGMVDNVPE